MEEHQDVASDGSPVEVYLALPAGRTPTIIDSVLSPSSSILELGSGPGRITRHLEALGHQVVAVDNSPAMLSHIDYAETVLADVFTLDLDRSFDAVVAGSHLINTTERDRRQALLSVCSRHLEPGGVALVERYDPAWAADPTPTSSQVGPVAVVFEPVVVGEGWFRGQVTYRLGDRTWTQLFTAANVDDESLRTDAARVGLHLEGWLTEPPTWAHLTAIAREP